MQTDTDSHVLDGLRAVADPMRWQILEALAGEELCVCHLVDSLGAAQPLVSHHLRALRDAGLVTTERYRYWTYYRLEPEAVRTLGERLIGFAESAPPVGRTRRPCC